MAWPDISSEWRNVDEYPNHASRESVRNLFVSLAKITDGDALRLGAEKGGFDRVPCFRFDEEALAEFTNYRATLEARIRSGELSPVMEGHLAKFRGLIPKLALLNHLADGDLTKDNGPVSHEALLKALAFAVYLESHAHRVYSASNTVDRDAATAILSHIRKGDLSDGFTARDVHQKDWAKLTDRDHVQAGLDLLVDLDCLEASGSPKSQGGGRPKTTYNINPKVRR
jgi:hypothetical protein